MLRKPTTWLLGVVGAMLLAVGVAEYSSACRLKCAHLDQWGAFFPGGPVCHRYVPYSATEIVFVWSIWTVGGDPVLTELNTLNIYGYIDCENACTGNEVAADAILGDEGDDSLYIQRRDCDYST